METYKAVAIFWGMGQELSITVKKRANKIFIQRFNEQEEQAKMFLEFRTLKFQTASGQYSVLPKKTNADVEIMKLYNQLNK